MKKCCFCKIEKNIEEFGIDKQTPTGIARRCKNCNREKQLRKRREFPEKTRTYDRERYKKNPERMRLYRKKIDQKMKDLYPEKYFARNTFGNAIKRKKISRPDKCEKCNRISKVQGHHDDYTKPLEVIWLCIMCHAGKHRKV